MTNSGRAGVGKNRCAFLTQKERDSESGLDYFLARYYSSALGRLTSPDEFTGGPREVWMLGSGDNEKQALPYADATNPQSLNKYAYCLNNPLFYVDPDGHQERAGQLLDQDIRAYLAAESPKSNIGRVFGHEVLEQQSV